MKSNVSGTEKIDEIPCAYSLLVRAVVNLKRNAT